MGLGKWDLETSIGDWARRRWVFLVPVILLCACTQDTRIVATIDIGHIQSSRLVDFNAEFLTPRTEIITDSMTVYIERDIRNVPIGVHAWINRTNLGDYIAWDGLDVHYRLR